MKLETFFEKFDQFANVPDAATTMRKVVLHLALCGGFSGPSSKSWKSVQLDELLEVQNGFAFKSSFFNEVNLGMPLIRIRDIANSTTQVFYNGDYRKEFVVRRGDLIIGMDGNFNIHRWQGDDALLNQRVCRLRNLSPRVDQQFLFYFVQEHLDEIHRNTTYTTVKHISSKQIEAIRLPCPPLAEQKRIVAKVDELMALCDLLEAQHEERKTRHARLARASLARFADAPTPANLQFLFHRSYDIDPADLRQSILTLAVQGKLVPQEPNDEPASLLLKRIASTTKARHQKTDKFGEIEAPFQIPQSWAWVRLPRVLTKLTDGTHCSPPNGPSGAFMYVTAKNIKADGVLLDEITYVSKETHEEIYSRCDPSFGDVLYIKDGATTGIATINQVKKPFSMLSSVALLKPSEAIFNRYLLWAIRSPFFYAETRRAMKGAAITRVTLSVMAASLLPLPPLAEQYRIVAKVEHLMTLVDELATRLGASRAAAKDLLDALVAELTTAGPLTLKLSV